MQFPCPISVSANLKCRQLLPMANEDAFPRRARGNGKRDGQREAADLNDDGWIAEDLFVILTPCRACLFCLYYK